MDVIWMLLAQRGIIKVRSCIEVLHALAFNGRIEQCFSLDLVKDHIMQFFGKLNLLPIQVAYSNADVFIHRYSITSLTKIYLIPHKISGIDHRYF